MKLGFLAKKNFKKNFIEKNYSKISKNLDFFALEPVDD